MSIAVQTTSVSPAVDPYADFFAAPRSGNTNYKYRSIGIPQYQVVAVSREVLEMLSRAVNMLSGGVAKRNEARLAAQKEWDAVSLQAGNTNTSIESLNIILARVTNGHVKDLQKFLLATKHNSAGYNLRQRLIIDAMKEDSTQPLARVLLQTPIGLGNRRDHRLANIKAKGQELGLTDLLGLDKV